MSTKADNEDEICENNNYDFGQPPEVDVELPARKHIGKTRVDWSSIESELPIDLLMVTVKDHEFVNCYYYLKNTKRSFCQGLGMVDFGTFAEGGVKVALIRCEKGTTEPRASLAVVTKAAEILKPRAVTCVGYCGSINPEKAKLGDVVISNKLATYSSKKINTDGSEELRGIKVNVSRNMADLIPYAADGWEPPLKDLELSNFEVDVHREYTMLSGPELVNNLEKRQQLLQHCPDAVAIEMEGEGLYAAAYNLGIEWAVVKGVSDYADGGKESTKDWQPFASAMAASVVHHMFKYPDVIRQWPNYQKPVQGALATAVADTVASSSPVPSIPIEQFLKSIAGTKEGKRMYNGRTIEYSVSGRVHSFKEPWVFDATATDVAANVTVEKKHFKTADRAINGAIEELVKRLKERKLIQE